MSTRDKATEQLNEFKLSHAVGIFLPPSYSAASYSDHMYIYSLKIIYHNCAFINNKIVFVDVEILWI